CRRSATRADWWCTRQSRRPSRRLCVPSTLPVCHRPLPCGGAAADFACPRARDGLPGGSYTARAGADCMSILEIRDLEVVYRGRDGTPVRAVAGTSLSVDVGEIVGLVGETGCGKSSLARAAVGLE